MKAELYYFDGCPSYQRALENLKQALCRTGLPEHVDVIPVADERDAQAKRFIGSPTIRLDGMDVEGPGADEQGYGFGCRVYRAAGTLSGWPSVEQIERGLQQRRAAGATENR